MRTAHGIQLRWLYGPMWASARSPRVGNGLDRSARTAPPASLGARVGDFPGIAPREAGKQVTGINIIKEESPWIRIWLPGRKPGSWGSKRRKRKRSFAPSPRKSWMPLSRRSVRPFCPVPASWAAWPGRKRGLAPPRTKKSKIALRPSGFGRPSGTSGPWAFSGRTRRKRSGMWESP